jgi:hypothetical protein
MTIQQTIEIPISHRVFIDVPQEIPAGVAELKLIITPRQRAAQLDIVPQTEPEEWVNPLFGICEGSSLTVEKFLAMTHEDRLLEDEIDERQRLESEKYRK